MYPYTRFRDPKIEQTNQQTELSDLFDDAGTQNEPQGQPQVASVNAIGLLPSGPGLASLSVASVSGIGVVAITGAWWLGRRQDKKSESDPARKAAVEG